MSKMLWAAPAGDQCASLLDQAVQTLALTLKLPPRYLLFAELFISLWKKQVWTRSSGKNAHVSILKTSCRLRLQMLLTSLTSRTDHYFAFPFGIASLQINIWSIRIRMYAREFLCALRYVFANNYMNVGLLFWHAMNTKFGHAKFCKN